MLVMGLVSKAEADIVLDMIPNDLVYQYGASRHKGDAQSIFKPVQFKVGKWLKRLNSYSEAKTFDI